MCKVGECHKHSVHAEPSASQHRFKRCGRRRHVQVVKVGESCTNTVGFTSYVPNAVYTTRASPPHPEQVVSAYTASAITNHAQDFLAAEPPPARVRAHNPSSNLWNLVPRSHQLMLFGVQPMHSQDQVGIPKDGEPSTSERGTRSTEMSSHHYSNVDQMVSGQLIIDHIDFLTEVMVPGLNTWIIIHHEGYCENRFTSK